MPLKIAKYCAVPGCGRTQSLHNLPSDTHSRNAWLKFIFKDVPAHVRKTLSICSLHFTSDSFVNKAEVDDGFVERLKLKSSAVPSILDPIGMAQQSYASSTGSCPSRLDVLLPKLQDVTCCLSDLISFSATTFPSAVVSPPASVPAPPQATQVLKEQNRLLTQEVSEKSDRITQLEQEKSALIKQLFEARARNTHDSSVLDSTFI